MGIGGIRVVSEPIYRIFNCWFFKSSEIMKYGEIFCESSYYVVLDEEYFIRYKSIMWFWLKVFHDIKKYYVVLEDQM